MGLLILILILKPISYFVSSLLSSLLLLDHGSSVFGIVVGFHARQKVGRQVGTVDHTRPSLRILMEYYMNETASWQHAYRNHNLNIRPYSTFSFMAERGMSSMETVPFCKVHPFHQLHNRDCYAS